MSKALLSFSLHPMTDASDDKQVLELTEEAAEMMTMPGAELLELKSRDLLDYKSIMDVIEGCSAVFLTIPPCESLNGLPDYPVGTTLNAFYIPRASVLYLIEPFGTD